MNSILVVDDDPVTRQVLRSVLTRPGSPSTVANDGIEALEAMRNRRFDLLLLDVWMPRMNGLDLLERLRTRKTRPRVVVMTSDDAPETLLEAVRQQAFKYMHKPIASAELLQTVHDVLPAADAPRLKWFRRGLSGSSWCSRAAGKQSNASRPSWRTSMPISLPTFASQSRMRSASS